MSEKFQVVVIGGGPGGYVCAIRLAQLGLKTACIDSRDTLGGTCLNIGCIPSKSLLNLSEKFTRVKKFSNLGIEVGDVKLNLEKMMKNKDKAVSTLTKGVEFLFKKNKVTHFKGVGSFKSENINVGLGADALIKDIFIWHSIKYNQNKRVGFGLPNYFMYILNSTVFGYKIFNYQIDPSNVKKLDVNFVKRFLKKNKISLLAISNPSHPFEKNWSLDEIREITKFCKKHNIIFVIDEVYQGLGSASACSLIKKFQNLIIIRSFSKACGLPGIRVGYTVATKKLSKDGQVQ